MKTLEGLNAQDRAKWSEAFWEVGASQCGFCTPGIIVRLVALNERRGCLVDSDVQSALLAHLCRCTGWQSILEAARLVEAGKSEAISTLSSRAKTRNLTLARHRATLESGSPQDVGPEVSLGRGGFADDLAPAGCLVAVPDGRGGFCVGESLAEARANAGKVQGRNTTVVVSYPLEIPEGDWALRLRTTFVEPGYLEPDAAWCQPGGPPASPLANGGAFGGKLRSPVSDVSRSLADRYGRPVRVVLSREDVVRMGPKRPPIAAGIRADGSGVIRVATTPDSEDLSDWIEDVGRVLPKAEVERVAVAGPPVSSLLRGAGWAEASVLAAALATLSSEHASRVDGDSGTTTVTAPNGAIASATIEPDRSVSVSVAAGEALDEVVLRSYVMGAVHQALGWVRTEGIAVSGDGEVLDLTIRSFGIITARDMPTVRVSVEPDERPPLRAGDAVFAAVAAAAWITGGLEQDWPTARGSSVQRRTGS